MSNHLNLQALSQQVRSSVRDKYGELFLSSDSKDHDRKAEVIIRQTREIAREENSEIEEYVISRLLGLGELDKLFKDSSISEIMINKPDEVWIERNGKITLTDIKFDSEEEVKDILDRMVRRSGRRVDFSHPLVNARLSDGSRVNAVIQPNSEYPVVTIRRFVQHNFNEEDLLAQGYLDQEILKFIKFIVKGRLNVIICGAAGSGKTTLLRLFAKYIPRDERLIVIEDVRELRLEHPHVISLEATEKVGIYVLMVNSLRMRPDRIILGEGRGMETFELLQAMGTGHDGSLTTIHANHGKHELVQRLVRAMLKSGMQDFELRSHILGALDLSVFIKKYKDGTRRIVNISEVIGNNGEPGFRDIFQYDHQSKSHAPKGSLSNHLIERIKENIGNEELPNIMAFRGE